MKKHKKIMISLSIIVVFVILLTGWLYWLKVNARKVYGQFYPLIDTRLTQSTRLNFGGKSYKNITGSNLGDSILFGGKTLGQVKTFSGDRPILIYEVPGHKDLLMVSNQREEGWSGIFQEK